VVLPQQSDRTDVTERRSDRVRAPVSLPRIAALEAVVQGSVVPRDSPDFEVLRKPAWAQFEDIAPEAVVLSMTAADVAETITFARRVGAEIAARSGGHCFAGRSSTRGILIDLSEMRSVSVADASRRSRPGRCSATSTSDLTVTV
jgi:hypothetical protein